MAQYKPLSVRGDGNCFFRALYQSAKNAGLLPSLLAASSIKTWKTMSEDGFVTAVRNEMADSILADEHPFMRSMFKEWWALRTSPSGGAQRTLRVAFSLHPSWYFDVFRYVDDYAAFRNEFAELVRKSGSFAGEVEVTIMTEWLRSKGVQLCVVADASALRKLSRTVALLHTGNDHYDAVVKSSALAGFVCMSA